ncbi:MAG: D-alanine--D-alanine ligase [Firmicutes bacterium]|nr:D-alanine--D-alanine ligase [Bacillota bacterium]
MKKRVGVIFGGRSVEHEVSVITALQAMENIDKSKFEAVPIFINKEGKWFTGESLKDIKNFKNNNLNNLKEIVLTPYYRDSKLYIHPEKKGLFGKKEIDNIDVFLPLVHGTNGEDGTLQGLLELANIPFVGAGVLASSVGMDKVLMKDVFKSYNLPMVEYMWFFRRRWLEERDSIIKEVEEKLSYPVFVKPANLGSSVGITKAKDTNELIAAIEIAIRYDRKIIIEQGIDKPREINIAVMGYDDKVKTSLCEEPLGWQDFLSYEDKYIKGDSKSGEKNSNSKRQIPANIDEDQTKSIENIAKEAFMSIDCKGNARIDFLMDNEGNIYINEINTIPGSMAFYLWEPAGTTFTELITDLINIAEKTHSDKSENMYSYDVDLFKRKDLANQATKL